MFCRALRTIQEPRFVRFLINDDATAIVMEPYDKIAFQSIRVPKRVYHKAGTLEIYSAPLCQLFSRRLGWDSTRSYRVPGKILEKQGVVWFDLSSAVQIKTDENETVKALAP